MYNFFKGRLLFVRLIMLLAALSLVAIGIITIYSISNPVEVSPTNPTEKLSALWKKQTIFAVVAFFGFIVANRLNYRRLGELSHWIYAVVLLLLAVVLLGRFVKLPFVPMINGTHRWIQFSIAGRDLPSIQPSEFCKVAYIIALAWYLRYKSNYRNFNALLVPFLLTLLPMLLILLEPDLGTVMLMMPILFTMLFVAGAKVKHLLFIILLAAIVSPLMWMYMESYQKARISSVIFQSEKLRKKAEDSPRIAKILVGEKFSERKWKRDEGFHLIRSKYAIASGGIKGYGFRKGPFIKYDFLPERENDFIFAAIAHQWGLKGCLILLGIYIILIGCGVEIAVSNTDPFARLFAVGIIAMFTVEVLINVSMTLGLMPITGLTLPLVSYGGSSLLVSMISLGLLNNIGRCRPFTVAPKSFQ
jgi:rod shape determining protein RodA